MNNQRIDIGPDRWMELRDGLFIYARTYGRRRLDLVIAPELAVSRGPLSEEPPLSSTLQRVMVALFLFMMFGLAGFVVQDVIRRFRGISLPGMIPITLLLAGLLAWRMLRKGSRLVTPGTRLFFADYAASSIRISLITGENPELDAALERLPTSSWLAHPCFGTIHYRLLSPFAEMARATILPIMMVGLIAAIWIVWNSVPPKTFPLMTLFWVLFWLIPVVYHGYHALTLPRALHTARTAIIEGDYAAASIILRGVLDTTADHPFGNYYQTALALIDGDLEQAAKRVESIEHSKLVKFLTPPLRGIRVDLPAPMFLRGAATFLENQRSGNLDTVNASATLANAESSDEHPAH